MSQPSNEQQKSWALPCPTCGAAAGQACDKPKAEHGVAAQRQPVHRARYMAGVAAAKGKKE